MPSEVDVDVVTATAKGAGVAIVEAGTADVQALPPGEQTVLVDQGVGIEGELAVADQIPRAVIQGAASEGVALSTGNFTALVVQVAGGGTEIEGNGTDEQRAVLIVQAAAADRQLRGRMDQP